MTNPNNAVGTPAAFSGRTSVKAFNNPFAAYCPGVLEGWKCSPVTGLTVAIGGTANYRDVAIAENTSRAFTTICNISEAPIEVTLPASPTNYPRIDAIVLYCEPNPTGDGSTQDNPGACGIIPVAGTAQANPEDPTDGQIRAAITTDGGDGADAYYVVAARIQRSVGQTTIASGDILKVRLAQPPVGNFTRLVGHSGGDFNITNSAVTVTGWAYDWFDNQNLEPNKTTGVITNHMYNAWTLVTFQANFTSTGTECDIYADIYQNGSRIVRAIAHTAAGKSGTIQLCEVIPMNGGDTLEIKLSTSTSTAKVWSGTNYLRLTAIALKHSA